MGKIAGANAPSRSLKQAHLEKAAKIVEWFERKGVDLEELVDIGDVKLVGNSWDVTTADGTTYTNEQAKWELVVAPDWSDGPQWPLPQPVDLPKMKFQKRAKVERPDGAVVTAIIPDIQAPFHDEAAVHVALQIVKKAAPDQVVMNGDNLDFAALSRFEQQPGFSEGTNDSVQYNAMLCWHLRAIMGPDAPIKWLSGNHEIRLRKMVLANVAAAFGVTQARLPDDEDDENRPVLSVPHLCRLDETDVEYLPGYPADQVWISPEESPNPVRVIHGYKTGINAARDYLNEGVCTIYGHTHHRAFVERVQPDGRRIFSASAGALCAVDGSVPGYLSGYDDKGKPIERPTDWDQGVMLVMCEPDGTNTVEMVQIQNGRAWFRGELLEGP